MLSPRTDGISNTLTGVEKDNYLIEFEFEMENKRTERPEGKGWVWDEEKGKWFRIRKLTPRECFRLPVNVAPDEYVSKFTLK